MLLVMALARSWKIGLAEISTAFLHASIEETSVLFGRLSIIRKEIAYGV